MSHSVCCYPQPGKPKSRLLCEAFARGAGGRVVESSELQPGPAAFYGVVGIEDLYRQARARGEHWYYTDNAYFDCARQLLFRVEKNGLQASGREPPDWQRFSDLRLSVLPWRKNGRHIVVAMQSDHFMREVVGWPDGVQGWKAHVLDELQRHTDRPIVVRHWQRDKSEQARSLKHDFAGAWALVTHMSAAANEAVVAGVPVFVTGRCAASAMAGGPLSQIERPSYADGREQWAAALAGRQWTVEEIASGVAWRTVNG